MMSKPCEPTPTFSRIQQEFAAAVRDPQRALPAAVTSYTARTPQKRFAVYRNMAVAGLTEALRARFQMTEKIVGEKRFAEAARLFVAAHPPRSSVLMFYGDKFPAFLAEFAPLATLRALPDLSRLEAARTRAYHASDAVPLDPAALRAIDPRTLSASRVILHPSAEILRSRYPVVTIWSMHSGGAKRGQVDEGEAEDALIVRPQFAVEVRKLGAADAAFFLAVQAGLPLGRAAERTAAAHPAFDLNASLTRLVSYGAVAGLIAPDQGVPSA
jgi:hypothetical protein